MADESVTKESEQKSIIQLNKTLGRRKSDLSELTGLGSTELIQFAGKQGLFTPLTDPDQPEESENNLQQLLLSMKQQMSQLQAENLQLKQQLQEERIKSHRTPDDFATAISHSIDSLQARLNESKNSVSRFALKQMDIDMRVFAEVTEMGTLDYRFIKPEESIDPQRLTNLKLTVVPIPKEDMTGSWTSPEFTPMRDIEEIQGIGEAYQRRLNQKNIYTVGDLLRVGTRVRSKVELANLLEVDHNRLSEWLNQAELMTVKDIDGRSAEVLAEIGITTLSQLAEQNEEQLLEIYNQRAAEKQHASLPPATIEQVKQWVKSASAYVGKSRTETAAD
jgi:predicted flap endonuclease-1-like 5' DNA nuclease